MVEKVFITTMKESETGIWESPERRGVRAKDEEERAERLRRKEAGGRELKPSSWVRDR